MVTLTNPINADNVMFRLQDFVTLGAANIGIVWGTTTYPCWPVNSVPPVAPNVAVVDPALNAWGGTTAGFPNTPQGSSIGGVGATINAATIYNTCRAAVGLVAAIRNVRAQLTITSTGGAPYNTAPGPYTAAGLVFDQTRVGYLQFVAPYTQTVPAATAAPATAYGLSTGSLIRDGVGAPIGLEDYFSALQTAYNTLRANTYTFSRSICHASCHTNCHSSRGRR